MAKIKFDKEKASTLIQNLTTLKGNIDTCLSNIKSCGTWKNNRDSDMLVVETRYYQETTVVDGVSETVTRSRKVNTYPNDYKVSNYNSALGSIQDKAEALKTTSSRIDKVINALSTIDELIEEFENTPGLTLSAELGDVADHNFSFLDKFGGSGYGGLNGPIGYLGSILNRIDITEFNRLGEDIIPTVDDEIPERIIDFDGDGKISISDYIKSYVQDSVNEEGIVVINGEELGELASLTFTTFLSNTNPEFLEEIEQGIEDDLHVKVDIIGTIASLAGLTINPENGEVENNGSISNGALIDVGMAGLSGLTFEATLETLLGKLDEAKRAEFESKTEGLTVEEKIEELKKLNDEFGNKIEDDLEHLATEEVTDPLIAPGIEDITLGAEHAADNMVEALGGANEELYVTTPQNKLEDLQDSYNEVNDLPKPSADKSYGNGYNGNGGNGDKPSGGGHGGSTSITEPPTQPVTEAPKPSAEVQKQPAEAQKKPVPVEAQKQPVEAQKQPVEDKKEPITEPPKHTPEQPPKNEHKPGFELISKDNNDSVELPTLKEDAVVEDDKVSSAGAGLLGAAGVGAGILNGGGNATPAIPSVDLGVTPPPAPVPSTMTTPNTPSTPTTTVQNNTPMTGATPDMDDMIVSQNPGVQQENNNTTHSSRTTADTSSEGITKGKYSSSGSGTSSSTSKQSKDTLGKDGEFKDDKDDNNVENKVDTTKPEGVLGEASYAELIAKEEKQIKVATAITASSMAVSIALSLASVIDVIVLVLLLLAAILAYSVFRNKKKKNIKRLEALIRIEKIKKEETDSAVKEEISEEIIDETSETEESNDSENENKTDVSEINEVEELIIEKKEFQSAEEVIYGDEPQHIEEVEELKEVTDSNKE